MQCYHPHTYEKLGFDVILETLTRYLSSEDARMYAAGIQPWSHKAGLKQELKRVHEFKQLLEQGESFPVKSYRSVSAILKKLEVDGNWLSIRELDDVWSWLKSIRDARAFLDTHKENCPDLFDWVHTHTFSTGLIRQIEKVLDERGNLREDASTELSRIRKNIQRKSGELRSTLYRILRHAQQQNWTQEKEITLRNDRLVIPVRAEAKGRVPGFVQDVSQSGGTVYIEPTEALALNNSLKEFQIKEQNEIVRILLAITAKVSNEREMLTRFRGVMLSLEVMQAKARLALELDANLPVVVENGSQLTIYNGRYPLLLLKAKQDSMEVVPLNISFSKNKRIVLISGPNAGGKSVAMKTIGLLQLMLQCGFLIPVNEDSIFRLFDSIFLDIGDEQSVDNDLSTYTSHLYLMRQMGDHMDGASLFLIDEFGSGTDPRQGGAIAESFLERFLRQRAYGVITTHYGNLKEFAEVNNGIVNAAMEFDTKELKPTYRLLEGMPGRSYAFEMAKRVGVHPSILRKANKKAGSEEMDAEQMIRELEKKNTRLTQLVNENKNREKKLERLLSKNEELKDNLSRKQNGILREAQLEARAMIEKANRDIERTIREIKEQQAAKEVTRKLRKELADSAPEVVEAINPKADSSAKKKSAKKKGSSEPEILHGEPIQEGDWVKLKNTSSYGQLVEIQGKKGQIESGGIRLTVKLNQLIKIRPPKSQEKRKESGYIGSIPATHARLELNVLGKRVEEALLEVDKFLDNANLAGLHQVRILHGKGTGALREAIRKHILGLHIVSSAKDAPVEQGGAGWTVVELKKL